MRPGELPLWMWHAGAGLAGVGAWWLTRVGARRIPVAMGVTADDDDSSWRRELPLAVGIAGLFVALASRALEAAPADASAARVALTVGLHAALVTGVVTAARIDLAHMLLPDALTLGGAAFALATSPWRGVGLTGSFIGVILGAAVGFLPALLYRKLRGRSGLGLGDAKLTVLAGAWLGPLGAVFVLFAGALQSTLVAVTLHVMGVRIPVPKSVAEEIAKVRAAADAGDEEARAALEIDPMAHEPGAGLGEGRLPLGPFLVLACVEFLFVGPRVAAALFG